MDYWNYIAHSQGSERPGHRYYARELIGNKGGKNQYRYFYTAEEYSAYKNSKGTPGRGTYAETGTSRNAAIWPKGTSSAHRRAEAKNDVERQKIAMDRARNHTSVLAAKVQMDADRYRKQRREGLRAKRAGQKAEMDAERNRRLRGEKHANRVTEAIAGRVKQDAEAYRNKRQAKNDRRAKQDSINAKRIGEQHSMDRKRWETEARAAQVKKDAEAYRKKRRNAAKAKRIGEQHSMDRKRWEQEARDNARNARGEKHHNRIIQAKAEQVQKDARAYRHKQATANVKREKIKMDAKRYRRQRHQAANERVRAKKRIIDNIRQRPYYQPGIRRSH